MIDNPIDAIAWLKQKSKRVRIGHDDYTDIANVIRELICQRAELKAEVDRFNKRLEELTAPAKPKPQAPFGTEGNGMIEFQIPNKNLT